MTDFSFIGNLLVSKKVLLYTFVAFFGLTFIATSALVFHWVKYSKELDLKYKIMPLIFIVGILLCIMISFAFFNMI